MHLSILTDIPVWVRPLAEALRERGAEIDVLLKPAAGGFGRGIVRLAAGEPAPDRER